MKTIISMLVCFMLIAPITKASDLKCDSLAKSLNDLNNKASAYVNKYKANIDSHGSEIERFVRGSAGDTASARKLIIMYEKDTAYFQRCIDTAVVFRVQVKAAEIMLAKSCDQIISNKKLAAIQDQDANTDIRLEGLIDYAGEMKKDWTKQLKHTRKEYKGLIEFYSK